MIVRNLPNVSKRWPPQNTQNDIHSTRSNTTLKKPPNDWKYKRNQKSSPLNIPQSVTNSQSSNSNNWLITPKAHTPKAHSTKSRKFSNTSNTSNTSNKSNKSCNSFFTNTSNISDGFRRRRGDKYNNAHHRKLYSGAYGVASPRNIVTPPRNRNISNHCVNKPLPPSPNLSRKSSNTSNSSTSSNGFIIANTKQRKKAIGYYNNTSIRKGMNSTTNINAFSDYNKVSEEHSVNPDTKRRLYDLFARDKLIKWVQSNTGMYEPIFVVIEHYGTKDQIIGRDSRGMYKLYNKKDVKEAPPYDHDAILINAVEQLLRGYQHRYKATSLRKEKVIEIVKRSKAGWIASGSTDTICAKVIGFEDKEGDITNVILQHKEHGTKHAFPVSNIQDNHRLNIETNEKLFNGDTNKRGSITQYVTPSYWLNGEQQNQNVDGKKKKQMEKQQGGLLQQIERMKNETKQTQNEIANKLKMIDNMDLKEKADKKGIAVLNVMWNQVLKRNKMLEKETESWRSIASEHTNENRLLKQQMMNLKISSKKPNHPQEIEKTETLQRELRLSLVEQKEKENTIRTLEEQNIKLNRQLQDLDRETKSMKARVEEISNKKKELQMGLNEGSHLQRGGAMLVDSSFLTVEDTLVEYSSLRDQEYHNLHILLKNTLKQRKGKTWHKQYIKCVCHEFMFLSLQLSFKYITRYNNDIYKGIGEILCEKQSERMEYVFHFYLQQNYEILFMDFKNKEMDNLMERAKQIYSKKTESHLSNEGYVLLKRYLDKCCSVCWLMILQRPKLTLYPKEFKPMIKSVVFDEKKHSKSIGSDRKSSHILYYIWPTVNRGNHTLALNIQVIVRDNDVPITNKRK